MEEMIPGPSVTEGRHHKKTADKKSAVFSVANQKAARESAFWDTPRCIIQT